MLSELNVLERLRVSRVMLSLLLKDEGLAVWTSAEKDESNVLIYAQF